MTKYNVFMTAEADLTVTVDIDDDGLDKQQIEELAVETAYDEGPGGLCAQCSGGWGQDWSLEIGDFEAIAGHAIEKTA